MRIPVFIFLLICYLQAEDDLEELVIRRKRDIKCARRLAQANVSSHIWGEICCDADLEELLLQVEEKADDSLGDTARQVQKKVQRLYDHPVEVILSAEEFAVSSYYNGQRMCKISNNGLHILAYQTPARYDINDTRTESWLAGIDSQDDLGSTLEVERDDFRDISTDPLADIDSGTHCRKDRRDGNKCCNRLLYTMMTKVLEEVSTSPIYNTSFETPGVVANVVKRRIQKRFSRTFEVIVSRDDFALATCSFGNLICKLFSTELYILAYETPYQSHFDVFNEVYEHGYSIFSREEILGTGLYMLPGQKVSMGIELESDGYRLGYPKDSHCDNERKGGSKCCHMDLFHSMHNSVMDLKSDDSFAAVDRRTIAQQMRKAAELAINQPLEMIVSSGNFHVASNHQGDCVCQFKADEYHIMAWRVPGNYTVGQDFYADNGWDDFTGCPREDEAEGRNSSLLLDEVVRLRRQTENEEREADPGRNKCCNRTLKYTMQKNFNTAMGGGVKLDANELSRKLARMAQMQYGSRVETIVSRGDFQFKSSGEMKNDACKVDMGGFNVMMYESGGMPDPNEFLSGDVAASDNNAGNGNGAGRGQGDGSSNTGSNSQGNAQTNSQSQSQSQSQNAQQAQQAVQQQSQQIAQNQVQDQAQPMVQDQAQQVLQQARFSQLEQQVVMPQVQQQPAAVPMMDMVSPVPIFAAGTCFSEDTWVMTPEGRRNMSEIQIGDYVLAANSEGAVFAPITHWLHREPDLVGGFFKLVTECGKILHISPKHLMFKAKCHEPNGTDVLPLPEGGEVFAYEVSVGDCVYVYQENTWRLEEIVYRTLLRLKGVYAPLTSNGKVIVNGILSSCYSDLNDQVIQYTYFEVVDKFYKQFNGLSSWLSQSTVISAPYLLHFYEELLYHVLPTAVYYS